MTTEIGEIIFSSDRTLFQVLDDLDVPNVSQQLEETDLRLTEVNSQLRQLGVTVDVNNLNTTRDFIEVNTRVDALSADFNNVEVDVIALQSSINILTDDVNVVNDQIHQLSDEVVTLTAEVGTYSTSISNLQVSTAVLQSVTADLGTRVTMLEASMHTADSNISNLQTRMTAAELAITQLKANYPMPGIVTGGIMYAVSNRASTNFTTRNLVVLVPYGVRCRWGEWYSCNFNSVNQSIKFLDPMGFMNYNSAPINQSVALNYSRIYYGNPTGTITYAEVYISIYNN